MRLRDIREDRDYTQSEIAKILNIKQNTYSQYESEDRQIPIEALIKLAIFYDLSIDYILGLIKEPEPLKRQKHKERKN